MSEQSTSPAGRSRLVRQNPRAEEPQAPAPAAPGSEPPSPAPVPKVRKTTPPKPPLSERLPEGVYANRPRQKRYVLHWLYFWAYARLGLYKLPARLIPVPRRSRREYRDYLIGRVHGLVQLKQLIYAVLNSKGGAGKTPISSWLIAVIKRFGHRASLMMEANENAGNGAYMLDVDVEDTLTLREYLANADTLSDHRLLDNELGHHSQTGVAVIASDQNTGYRITGKSYMAGGLNAARCYPFVGQDCGNGLFNQSNLGAVRLADVLLFAACIAKPSSYRDASSTYRAYREKPQLKLEDKVNDQSLMVLLGNRPKDVPRLMEKYRFPCRPEQIKLIPKDPYMVSEEPVDLNKIRLKTLIALLELAVAVLELAPDKEEPALDDLANHFEEYEELELPEELSEDDSGETMERDLRFVEEVDRRAVPRGTPNGSVAAYTP